jgi:hypothetical protein
MGKYYRTTITITRSLMKRMRAIGRAVNWSLVAREAFERKIDEVNGKKTELQELREEVEKLKARKE